MSNYTVIAEVGNILVRLLTDAMKEEFRDDVPEILLESPKDITESKDTSKRQLSLFLYRVLENHDLKNQPMQTINSDKLKYPPLSLSLYYMLTPYCKDRSDEHRLLGKAMQVFYDHSILEGSDLVEGTSLAGSDEELRVTLNPMPMNEVTEVWNALTTPYRLSVCYEVTPVKIDSTRTYEGARVIEKDLEYAERQTRRREK